MTLLTPEPDDASNSVRTVFEYALQKVEMRPIHEQVQILNAIADCTIDDAYAEMCREHAAQLQSDQIKTIHLRTQL